MSGFARLVEHPVLVIAGWTLVMVVWESAALAVLLEGWRAMRPRAHAREQYAVAGAALALTLLLALATPFVLARVPSVAVDVATSSEAPVATPAAPSVAPVAPRSADFYEATGVSVNALAGAAGVLWIVGAALLALNLAGGWLVARRVRRLAAPVTNPSALASVARLRDELRISLPIELLQSPEVEAPVVLGWRHPALILPNDIADQLSPEMIEALLVHEFAHIQRQDYVVNLVQAIAELLLFFSPAVVWISKRIREAREYCCDDFAVVTCGDPKRYVNALTTLAALGTLHRVKPSLGAAGGPRLIVRVRRLLQEESMTKLRPIRLAMLATAFLALTITGAKLGVVSVAYASSALSMMFAPFQDGVPFGYASEQPGSAVEMSRFVSSPEHPAELATIRNTSTETVSGIAFAAIVEFIPTGANRLLPRRAVRIFTSEIVPVSIAPGKTAEVIPNVLTAGELQDIAAGYDGRVQLFFGLAKVRYANGHEWSVTPNPAASSGMDALSLQRADVPRAFVLSEIPRALVAEPGTVSQANPSMCRDAEGKTYSLGAMVGIRSEPGRFARCLSGAWIETARR
jgi:beta-lactamase regulating signal transducer with metallopeptidase domain